MITNKYGIHTFSLKLQCKYSKIQNIIEQNECIRTSKGKLGLSPYYQITQFKDIGVEIQQMCIRDRQIIALRLTSLL